MRKNVFGRQFSRDTNQRKSLFKSLISSLILDESIKTTVEKAKAIKGDVDKIINRAKRGNERLSVQLLQRNLGIDAMNKVIKNIAPRFKDRNSGYTRTIKLGRRFSDDANMVLMEWVVKSQKSNLPTSLKLRGTSKTQNLEVKELSAGKAEEKPKQKESKRKAAKK